MKRALLALLCVGCTYKAPLADDEALLSAPGVSAPVIESVRLKLAASNARVTTFNCQAHARTLLPWKGTDYTNPLFRAANEATLPDAPEFTDRRSAGCAILEKATTDGQTASR